jgi:hypothetical protein
VRKVVEPQLVKALLGWLVVLLQEEALKLKAKRQLELELERRLELVILLKTKRQRVDLVDLGFRLWILRLDQLLLLILRL